jgi:hypothetical protein
MANKNRLRAGEALAAKQRGEAARLAAIPPPLPPEDPDLLLELAKAFRSHQDKLADEAHERGEDSFVIRGEKADLHKFLVFARAWLRGNLPAGFDFSGPVPSIRLQNGEVWPIVSFPAGEVPGIDGAASGGIPINLKTRADGRGDTVQTPAWGVTGVAPPK